MENLLYYLGVAVMVQMRINYKTSKIKCPKPAFYQAFTVNDEQKSHLITSGFVRGFNIDSFFQQDLLQIIGGYYMHESIHLIQSLTGDHHKIDVFHLFEF